MKQKRSALPWTSGVEKTGTVLGITPSLDPNENIMVF
jgi:hypothetical protein